MEKPPDWRSENYAKAYENYDRTDFAQEFLRRNPEYRDQYAEAVDAAPLALRRLARHWGLVFRCGPRSSSPPSPDCLAPIYSGQRHPSAPGTIPL